MEALVDIKKHITYMSLNCHVDSQPFVETFIKHFMKVTSFQRQLVIPSDHFSTPKTT
jgi:hypothetical protein